MSSDLWIHVAYRYNPLPTYFTSILIIVYRTYFTMAGVKNPFQMSVVKSCIGILGCAISLYMVHVTPAESSS
jgi:hypothetical protein